jgi:hypothetical protein
MDKDQKQIEILPSASGLSELTMTLAPTFQVPLLAITIHPDYRPSYSQAKCYLSTVNSEGKKKEFSVPFLKALEWFKIGTSNSPNLTAISIKAIGPLAAIKEWFSSEERSELTQVMEVLLEIAPLVDLTLRTFDFQIEKAECPLGIKEDSVLSYETIQMPLRRYFEIVPYWIDTLCQVTFCTQGWGYEKWTELFKKGGLLSLTIDLAQHSLQHLEKVLHSTTEHSGQPLQELILDFAASSGIIGNHCCTPLVYLIQKLSPTSYFRLDLPTHWNVCRQLFDGLGRNGNPDRFQQALQILEFGPRCSLVSVNLALLIAFPNLHEIRGIKLHAALLTTLGQWLAGTGLSSKQRGIEVELVLKCLPANHEHRFFNQALSGAYAMRLSPLYQPLKIAISTPSVTFDQSGRSVDPLAIIVITHNDHNMSHPRQITLKIPHTSEPETFPPNACIYL